MLFFELLKAIFLGIVEDYRVVTCFKYRTLDLVQEFISLNQSKAFLDMFNIVIQLGAILAVIVIYFKRFEPISTW